MEKKELFNLYSKLYVEKAINKEKELDNLVSEIEKKFENNDSIKKELPEEYMRIFKYLHFDNFEKTKNNKYIVGFNSPFLTNSLDSENEEDYDEEEISIEFGETNEEDLINIKSHLFLFKDKKFIYNKAFNNINSENFFLLEEGKIFLIDSSSHGDEKFTSNIYLLSPNGKILFQEEINRDYDFFKLDESILLNYIGLDNKQKISLLDINSGNLIQEEIIIKKHFAELRNEISKRILDLKQIDIEPKSNTSLLTNKNLITFKNKKISEIHPIRNASFKKIKIVDNLLFTYDSLKTFYIIDLKSFNIVKTIDFNKPIIQFYIINQTLMIHSYDLENKKRKWNLVFINYNLGKEFSSISLFENNKNKEYFIYEEKIYVTNNFDWEISKNKLKFSILEIDKENNSLNEIKNQFLNLNGLELSFEINNRTFLKLDNRKIKKDIIFKKGIKGEHYEFNQEIIFDVGDNDFINEYSLERCPYHNNFFFPYIYDIYRSKKFKILKIDKKINVLNKIDFNKIIEIDRDDTAETYITGNYLVVKYNKNLSKEFNTFILNEDFLLLFYNKYIKNKPSEIKIHNDFLFISSKTLEIYNLNK